MQAESIEVVLHASEQLGITDKVSGAPRRSARASFTARLTLFLPYSQSIEADCNVHFHMSSLIAGNEEYELHEAYQERYL